MALNQNLHTAKRGKKDEFYTQLRDIENELRHYKHHFKNKVVYCNCDDPRV
ncbi:MAG: modification methylase, partial [Bacteroidetes bacterium]|nr:modification methylase [Bacteroidota bacterium]